MEDDRFVLRSVTDELMYELMELSGQEYVDIYASRGKLPRPEPCRRRTPPNARPSLPLIHLSLASIFTIK